MQLPIPTVAGTGPPYSNTPPPFSLNPTTPAGGPAFTSHYAGYWRLYTVVLPPEARVFAPPARPDVAADLRQAAPDFPLYEPYSDTIINATEPVVRGVAGMVALEPRPASRVTSTVSSPGTIRTLVAGSIPSSTSSNT